MPGILVPIAFVLDLFLVAIVAGNNLSVCVGSAVGSRMMSKRSGIVLTILAYIVGLLAQGGFLGHTVSLLLPAKNVFAIDLAMAITIVVFIIAELRRVPQSLTVTLTTVLVGIDVALGATNLGFMVPIAVFWISMPILSFVFVAIVMRMVSRRLPRKNIWSYVRAIKVVLIATSFFVAFTLGGNTIGLIAIIMPNVGVSPIGISYSMLGILTAIVIGSFVFSKGPLGRVGNDIIPMRYINAIGSMFISAFLVEIATLVGVPLSNTEAFISSVYGAGVSYKHRVIMRRPFVIIVSLWLLTAVIGFAVGLATMYMVTTVL